jgi:hypothetical protein
MPHHLPVVRLLQIGRRKAARKEQPIALRDRLVEALGEVDEQLPARARAASLHEAEMFGREARLQRKLERLAGGPFVRSGSVRRR